MYSVGYWLRLLLYIATCWFSRIRLRGPTCALESSPFYRVTGVLSSLLQLIQMMMMMMMKLPILQCAEKLKT